MAEEIASADHPPERWIFRGLLALGLVLLGALAGGKALRGHHLRREARESGLSTVTLAIREMGCSGCRVLILKNVLAEPGVRAAEPAFRSVTVSFDGAATSVPKIILAASKPGYAVRAVP